MSINDDIQASAARFERAVVPLFEDSQLTGRWERLEGTAAAAWLDVDHGCDWLLHPVGGRAILVSTRTQTDGSHSNFTIRYQLASGGQTEFQKLTSTDGGVRPGWMIQSHSWSEPDTSVIRAAAIRVDDLAQMLRRRQFYPPNGMSVAGGNRMVYVEWNWVRKAGFDLIERDGPGAARLRGYWPKNQVSLF